MPSPLAGQVSEPSDSVRSIPTPPLCSESTGQTCRTLETSETSLGGGLERMHLITAGFPCQPFSLAGERRSKDDDRYLWPETFAIIKTHRPPWFIGENVPGIVDLALDQVLSDLEGVGYAVQPFIVPACAVGANHIRRRVWIIANAPCAGFKGNHAARDVAERPASIPCEFSRRMPPPRRCGKNDGVTNRTHRVELIGNAIVPQVAHQILKAIRKLI